MGDLDDYKPTIFMFVLQFFYAGISLTIRAALLKGLSPRVFVVYRQAIATIVITPIAYFSRKKGNGTCLGWKSFWLIFLTALIGVSISQNIFFEGVYLTTSTTASAMYNLVPALTFVIALLTGMEKVNLHSVRSIAKIMGTTLCVGGACFMALLRGPKLLNSEAILPISKSLLGKEGDDNWVLGCLSLFGGACSWSIWLILQSAAIALVFDRETEAWKLDSNVEIFACLYTGLATATVFFGQAWCIARRGPLFCAMFNPLATVIVIILASIFLHEELYLGSLVGGITVVMGLYVVLWGKAEELIDSHDQIAAVKILVAAKTNSLEEPLLADKSTQIEGIQTNK